jgi:hypothetical protein
MSERNLIRDETTTTPTGATRRIMAWNDGSAAEIVTLPDTFPVFAESQRPVDMTRVSAAQINRLECEAVSDQERVDLESRWDEQWGS